MDFDLPSLETFVELARCGSFSETARTQSISQPAVSLRVAKLESIVGLRLFIRRPEGVELTPDGIQLLDVARSVLHEHQQLRSRMSRFLREDRAEVKLWLDGSIPGSTLASQVDRLALAPQSLHLTHSIDHPSWDQALLQQEIDIAVTGTFLNAGEIQGIRRFDLETQRGTTIAWNRSYFDFDTDHFNFPETLRSAILVPSESLVRGYLSFLRKWCLDSYGALPPDIRVFDNEESAREACWAGLGVLVFPGDAESRMNLSAAGLGVVRTFEFLLPEAYSYSIYIRAEERNSTVLKTALRVSETFRDLQQRPGHPR